MKYLIRLLVLSIFLCCRLSSAQEPILTVAFNNKPPFFYFEEGQAKGLLVERAKSIFQKANIAYTFEELPFNRVMLELERKRPMFAALGFSKTPEREVFVNFSAPLYRDHTPIILIRSADAELFRNYTTLQHIANSKAMTFGGKTGNTYPIDSILHTMGERDRRFEVEANQLPKLLVLGRFDFTMIFPEELSQALVASDVSPTKIQQLSYSDIPMGGYRYLLFSQSTPKDILSKVNNAINTLLPNP